MSATVCSEIQESFAVHTELGSRLAGIIMVFIRFVRYANLSLKGFISK